MSYISTIKEARRKLWLPGTLRGGDRAGGGCLVGIELHLGAMKVFRNESDMIVRHCECTKCHWVMYTSGGTFMLCEFQPKRKEGNFNMAPSDTGVLQGLNEKYLLDRLTSNE